MLFSAASRSPLCLGVRGWAPPACCPLPAGTLSGALGRAVGAEPCRLGERSCGAEGVKRAALVREINSALYMPLSGRLGSIPMGLGLSCGRWLMPTLAPMPGTPARPQPEASAGHVGGHCEKGEPSQRCFGDRGDGQLGWAGIWEPWEEVCGDGPPWLAATSRLLTSSSCSRRLCSWPGRSPVPFSKLRPLSKAFCF